MLGLKQAQALRQALDLLPNLEPEAPAAEASGTKDRVAREPMPVVARKTSLPRAALAQAANPLMQELVQATAKALKSPIVHWLPEQEKPLGSRELEQTPTKRAAKSRMRKKEQRLVEKPPELPGRWQFPMAQS